MTSFASSSYTYQWSDANGTINGATSATYVANASGSYSLTVTNANGCVATSNAVTVTIITPSTPGSLSTSNIQLDRATMNWGAVANAHHYDVRFREQGSAWQVLYVSSTSLTKYGLSSSTCLLYTSDAADE